MVGEEIVAGKTSSHLLKPVETCSHNSILHSTLCVSKEHTMNREVTLNPRPTVYKQYELQFAYNQARKSEWEHCARDRARFMRRIIEYESILNPILNESHRDRVLASSKQ